MHLTTSNESQVASLIRNVVFVVAAVAAAIAFKVNNVAYAQCANMAIWVLRIRRVSRSTASSSANCAYAWRMQRRAALCSESASAAAVAGPGQLAGFSSRSSRALRDPLLTLPVIVPTVQTVGAMRFDLNRPVQRLSQALVVATLFLSLSFFLLALFPLSLSLFSHSFSHLFLNSFSLLSLLSTVPFLCAYVSFFLSYSIYPLLFSIALLFHPLSLYTCSLPMLFASISPCPFLPLPFCLSSCLTYFLCLYFSSFLSNILSPSPHLHFSSYLFLSHTFLLNLPASFYLPLAVILFMANSCIKSNVVHLNQLSLQDTRTHVHTDTHTHTHGHMHSVTYHALHMLFVPLLCCRATLNDTFALFSFQRSSFLPSSLSLFFLCTVLSFLPVNSSFFISISARCSYDISSYKLYP